MSVYYAKSYPQNGEHIVTIDSVTLFHPMCNASITILVCQIISGPVPTPVLRTCDRHRRQRRRGCSGRDPPIFDLQGSSCVDDPPIFWQVFYFFFHSTELDTWILKTTHPECTISHHFQMKNSFINLLGRGTASILLDSRIFGARPATPPMFQWRWRNCDREAAAVRLQCDSRDCQVDVGRCRSPPFAQRQSTRSHRRLQSLHRSRARVLDAHGTENPRPKNRNFCLNTLS